MKEILVAALIFVTGCSCYSPKIAIPASTNHAIVKVHDRGIVGMRYATGKTFEVRRFVLEIPACNTTAFLNIDTRSCCTSDEVFVAANNLVNQFLRVNNKDLNKTTVLLQDCKLQ